MKRLCIFSFFILFIFSSCGADYAFEQTLEVPNQTWTQKDSLVLQADITDTMKIYNLYLDIKHDRDYDYQNIYVMIHTTFPSGQKTNQRINIDLFDVSGNPSGKCSGQYCEVRVDLQKGAFFNAIGEHRFVLEQYMRKDALEGIKELSFKLEDMKQSR